MESVIARVLKDPKQSIKGMRLLRFARNDRGLVSDPEGHPTRLRPRGDSDPEGGVTPSIKRGYAKLSRFKGAYKGNIKCGSIGNS